MKKLLLFFGILVGLCYYLWPQKPPISSSWQTTNWVWNFNFIIQSDKGLASSPEAYFHQRHSCFNPAAYKHIHRGDLVWVSSRYVKKFYKKVLGTIHEPFVLIINDGDEAFPSDHIQEFDVEALIHHPMILHIFAQNCDYKGSSDKVSPLPIGLDLHGAAYKRESLQARVSPQEQEEELNAILASLPPTSLRKKRAFVDFQHHDNMKQNPRYGKENRTTIFQRLKETNLIDYGPIMERSMLWKTKGNYAFSISPHGNGLDCHRTWEDLILGCIVIVKTSPLDPLYEGLPVVIVQDWDEITEENLDRWLSQYHDAFTHPSYREKLTNFYWLNKMRSIAKQSLSKQGASVL